MYVKVGGIGFNVDNSLRLAKDIFRESYLSQLKIGLGIIDEEEDWVKKDADLYTIQNKRENFNVNQEYNMYIYNDKCTDAGTIDSYFWQDLWAARKIYQNAPLVHYDIGSSVDGFIWVYIAFISF